MELASAWYLRVQKELFATGRRRVLDHFNVNRFGTLKLKYQNQHQLIEHFAFRPLVKTSINYYYSI